eukprot:699086-Hanusia_phi.AAC.5
MRAGPEGGSGEWAADTKTSAHYVFGTSLPPCTTDWSPPPCAPRLVLLSPPLRRYTSAVALPTCFGHDCPSARAI